MTDIISYRLSANGMWGYSYYQDETFIGKTTCQISTSSTVRVTGEDVEWYSSFNIDTEIVPGVSRRIKDNLTGEELYRIVFWRPGLYEIAARTDTGGWSRTVEERKGAYFFGRTGMPVSAIMERIIESDWTPPTGMQIEPAFRTRFFEQEDSPGFLMMVLSFPAMKMI